MAVDDLDFSQASTLLGSALGLVPTLSFFHQTFIFLSLKEWGRHLVALYSSNSLNAYDYFRSKRFQNIKTVFFIAERGPIPKNIGFQCDL
ncbi:hypothetical protein BK123_26780 [Paenibacillus lautus]|uniref:Uncharacterized protein n=1 Tax=Paenibacillus lautus TaxID=1401 RepID=A0A1R1AVD8_PAELA|nr:hypothetical protein BK123_26780 [Paenibacillus lautus]